tara:strand:+ start:618 stop:2681 length:2064 start_codon:yes stop_codon:yes gene_type:complete
MATTKTTEKSTFKLHPNMLYQAILRQAGSLEKAVLEGGMNSKDANAENCDITLTRTELRIVDDGQGFRNRKEIDEWFEVFGMPQDPDSDKTYGQFRMGRGQMFAFGVNTWHSGKFIMSGIDIKKRGLDYDLTTQGNSSKGCDITVKLYKKLSEHDLLTTTRAIERLLRWMPSFGINLTLNGESFGKDARKEKWTFETPEAWVKLTDGSNLDVYNLGAFVKGMYVREEGRGGTVVTKKMVEVNFARNDVMSSCKIWQAIRSEIRKRSGKVRKTMNDAEREYIAECMLTGDIEAGEAKIAKVFTDVSGRHWSAKQLHNRAAWNFGHKMTHVAKGNRLGDKVHQQKLAFVMADVTLDRFETSSLQIICKMIKKYGGNRCEEDAWKIVPFSKVTTGMSTGYDILDIKELKPTEEIWVKVLLFGEQYVRWGIGDLRAAFFVDSDRHNWRDEDKIKDRRICIGVSDSADAWTDGSTYIAFDRGYLARLKLDMTGVCDAYLTLLHEFCHDDSDTASHEHGVEFYQTFHDARTGATEGATHAWKNMPRIIENMGRKLGRREVILKDRIERLGTAVEDMEKIAASVAVKEVEAKGQKPVKVKRGKGKGTTPPTPPTPPQKAEGNPYKAGTVYARLFDAGQDWVSRKALIAKVAADIGKPEKNIGFSYSVVGNANHRSNSGSKAIKNDDGLIKFVVA